MRLVCPRCHLVIESGTSSHPTCPRCGFSGAVTEPAGPASFRIAARGAAPAPVPPVTYATQPARPPPPAAPPPYPYGPHAPSPTNTKALVSLILGVVGVTLVPLVAGIVAIVLGHSAKRELRDDPRQTGDGLATAGIVLGWIGIGIALLALALILPALFFVWR